MATKARQIYTADEETLHKDKRTLEIESWYKTKIDWIEDWAQVNVIEWVKVNWTKLTPDAQKNVNVEVPIVVDNIYTADSEKALSANMGKQLSDEIENLKSRWRFLSFWNAVAGKPTSEPPQSPYTYHTWDYFIVDSVATAWWTNYRPEWTTYTTGDVSTTVETGLIIRGSMYIFDWTDWLLQAWWWGWGWTAQWWQIVGTLSNQTDLKWVLDSKITNPTSWTAGQVLTKTASWEAWQDVDWLPSQTWKSGKFLTTDGTDASWEDIPEELPSGWTAWQVLTKTASGVAWDDVDWLPDQTWKNGKYLKTNWTSASWEDAGDMKYADFEFSEKAWATLTLWLSSLVKPISDFTVNAPATIKDGQIYILRVENNWVAYSMTLGTNITDPYEVDYTLTDNATDQFVFLWVGWKLELQPVAIKPEDIPEVPVEDVKVNGTSVVDANKVANIDLSGKVDKTTSNTKVYATTNAWEQTLIWYSTDAIWSALARRNSAWALAVWTPTNDAHAATKKYVDDGLATAGQVDDVKVDWTSVVDANKVANISLNLSWTVQLASLSSWVYKSSWATYTTWTQSINIDYPHTLYFQYANDDYRYFTIVWHKDEEEDLVASKYLYSIPDDVIDLEKEIYYSDIWDMSYSDFEFSQPTGNTITLTLSTEITPSANFTVNAPSTVKEWQAYILRVTNWATPVTMTLWTGIVNPSEVDLTLTANAIDQFAFLGLSDWTLELQPGGSGDSLPDQTGNAWKFLQTNGTEASWQDVNEFMTQAEYDTGHASHPERDTDHITRYIYEEEES